MLMDLLQLRNCKSFLLVMEFQKRVGVYKMRFSLSHTRRGALSCMHSYVHAISHSQIIVSYKCNFLASLFNW
uniref:Uncharacterized protein n=1 Tax=Rhizophora mucronata TaxID=61149 RepID=A0A2P2L7T3_RHIMU